MTIQHSAITDPNIHEPKGVSLAISGDVYIANGANSGVWDKVDPTNLKGNSADFSSIGDRLVVNDQGGIGSEFGTSLGVMTFTGNATALSVADDTYATIFGPGAPWGEFVNKNATLTPASGSVTAPVAGIYRLSAILVADGTGFSYNIKTRFQLSGGVYAPFENIFNRIKNDKGTIAMEMIASLKEGETAVIQMAGDGGAGSITILSGAYRIQYLGAD